MKTQSIPSKWEMPLAAEPTFPIPQEEREMKDRVREVIGHEPVVSFARRCGISEGGMRKYLEGASPSTVNLIAMADVANVNIEWLASGRGPKLRGAPQVEPDPMDKFSVPLEDVKRLRMAIEGVEEALALMKEPSTPQINADLIAGAYELLKSDPKYTKNDVIRLIRLALISRTPVQVNVP